MKKLIGFGLIMFAVLSIESHMIDSKTGIKEEQLQQIESLQLEIESLKETNSILSEENKHLSSRLDEVHENYQELQADYFELEEQKQQVQTIYVEPEESTVEYVQTHTEETHVEENEPDNGVYVTRGHSEKYDAYIHDYKDCPFIEDKQEFVEEATSEDCIYKTNCKCMYSDIRD